MVWKKVNNSDAGDSSHFGGDDIDKISETFNAGTQTDPINIKDENLYVVDPSDTSKKVRFDVGDNTTSTTRIVKLPDADVTLASTTAASTSVAGLMSAADKLKLDGIEANATADQTNVEIKTAYEANTDTNAFTDLHVTTLGNRAPLANPTFTGTVAIPNYADVEATLDSIATKSPLASPTFTGTVNAADVILSGDLTVNGSTTTVNTATLSVEDPMIKLASGNNAADSVDVGFYGLYDVGGTDKYAGIVRDASDSGKFIAFKDLQTEPTTTVDKTATGYTKATIVADIEGNADTATTVADDAITLAKMAPGTDGNLITYDANGDPAYVTTGTSGQVLTSNGAGFAPTFQAAAEASPLTTKGDIYVYGTGNTRLAVSATDGQVLKADSTAATGLAWGDSGGAVAIDVGFSNTTSTTYRGSLAAGGTPTHSVGDNIATRALGTPREMYIRKIDANNEGVFTVIHKNGALVEVQIA